MKDTLKVVAGLIVALSLMLLASMISIGIPVLAIVLILDLLGITDLIL